MEYMFGSGTVIGTRTDTTTPTPVPLGVVQDIQTDFDFTLKELMGQYQSPVDIARAGLKIQGNAKVARIYGRSFNDLFFGQTLTSSSSQQQAVNENGTIGPTPYTVTVANSATFVADLGVFYKATGVQLTRVASGPTTGQYSVAAGVYTFAAADTGLVVEVNYTYTATSGYLITLTNQLMGAAPRFKMNLATTYSGLIFNLQLNACVASKLSLPQKNQDYLIQDLQFQAHADASGMIGSLSTSE